MKKSISGQASFNDILGESQLIKEAKNLGMRVASSNIPVLIEGENGCGKELLARSIHSSKDGNGKPFIAVNCGAIPDNLVESILFGHEKGAFTGAIYKTFGKFREADGGTIFLDEVGELSPEIQVKLLRVLQDGEIDPVGGSNPVKVNVRVISATNRDLAAEVKKGNFREDLYYRLNVFPIHVPSLRDRQSDIPMMIDNFIKLSAKSEHKNIKGIAKEAEDMLCKYSWPGNIRQLKNTIFRALVLCDREILGLDDFPQFKNIQTRKYGAGHAHHNGCNASLALETDCGHFKYLADIEKTVIEMALQKYNGRMSEIARRLGIGRSTLYRKLESYGVEVKHEED
jgi:DNA-binding NtrC family response regulator